jgi:hypothetical protein
MDQKLSVLFADGTPTAFDQGQSDRRELTDTERRSVLELGRAFAEKAKGDWLLISGRFTSGNGEQSTESRVKEILRREFGYPKRPDRVINVLLNSPGGSLDSAYTTVLYLAEYARELKVYVPDRAKSASTLLAVGADTVYLSAFGELGPLDTQIPDPRNPANNVSALDCYQSVDYVREFGFKTITGVLPKLIASTERRIPVNGLLQTASTFAIGAITPVLGSVSALDFGGWGRSLRIGEHYASKLLRSKRSEGDFAQADEIAYQLVFGYPHHLFPIDIEEAGRIGLNVERMSQEIYDEAVKVVDACGKKDFVSLISKPKTEAGEKTRAKKPPAEMPKDTRVVLPSDEHVERPQAEAGRPGGRAGGDSEGL